MKIEDRINYWYAKYSFFFQVDKLLKYVCKIKSFNKTCLVVKEILFVLKISSNFSWTISYISISKIVKKVSIMIQTNNKNNTNRMSIN